MPEQVIFMRGFPPSKIEALVAHEDLRRDLKAIAALSDDQITSVRKLLAEAKGFLDPKALKATVRQVIDDDGAAESVKRLLRNLGPTDIKRLMDALDERRGEKDFPFDQATIQKLGQTLPTLVQSYPALTRFENAERLARLTGQELESVDLICDLRPIFDETRKKIEGMMPYTRLHVVATGVDGLPKPFDAELTQKQVHDLAEKASKALDKLDALRQVIETLIPGGLPDLPLTRDHRKESTDA